MIVIAKEGDSMGHKITSVITITTEGSEMPKRHRKRYSDKSDGKKSHTYQSKAVSDKNRLFHNVKGNNNGVTQNVDVKVKVEQQEDCITSCFSGLAKCFGKGS